MCALEQGIRSDLNRLPTDVVAMQGATLSRTATLQPILRDSEMQRVRAFAKLVTERGVHLQEPRDSSRPISIVGCHTYNPFQEAGTEPTRMKFEEALGSVRFECQAWEDGSSTTSEPRLHSGTRTRMETKRDEHESKSHNRSAPRHRLGRPRDTTVDESSHGTPSSRSDAQERVVRVRGGPCVTSFPSATRNNRNQRNMDTQYEDCATSVVCENTCWTTKRKTVECDTARPRMRNLRCLGTDMLWEWPRNLSGLTPIHATGPGHDTVSRTSRRVHVRNARNHMRHGSHGESDQAHLKLRNGCRPMLESCSVQDPWDVDWLVESLRFQHTA